MFVCGNNQNSIYLVTSGVESDIGKSAHHLLYSSLHHSLNASVCVCVCVCLSVCAASLLLPSDWHILYTKDGRFLICSQICVLLKLFERINDNRPDSCIFYLCSLCCQMRCTVFVWYSLIEGLKFRSESVPIAVEVRVQAPVGKAAFESCFLFLFSRTTFL